MHATLATMRPPVFDITLPCKHVLVAFRETQTNIDGTAEHPLNVWSARLTRKSSDVAPCGSFCHVELCVQFTEGAWYRVSINKKTLDVDPRTGRAVWTPGKVHCKLVTETTLKRYVLCKVPCDREKQYKVMSHFLGAQLGGAFNSLGYVCNGLLGTWFGTTRYCPSLVVRRRRWFCSELICVMLQGLGVQEMRSLCACKTNPNSLYRTIQNARGAIHAFDPTQLVRV